MASLLKREFYAPASAIHEAAERPRHFNVVHWKCAFKVDLWVRKDGPYDQTCFRRRCRGGV